MSIKHTIYLNQLLFSNFFELFNKLNISTEVIYCLNNKDEDALPKNFFPLGSNYIFVNELSADELADRYLDSYRNNLLIKFNAIGITVNDIKTVFNLLSRDDDSAAFGVSQRSSNIFIGLNKIKKEILNKFFNFDLDYIHCLAQLSSEEIFIDVLKGFIEVKDITDFKLLYKELSSKNSLTYCSEAMREQFTDLFIEYKELLNE